MLGRCSPSEISILTASVLFSNLTDKLGFIACNSFGNSWIVISEIVMGAVSGRFDITSYTGAREHTGFAHFLFNRFWGIV
jgi:putative methionine-R-sulfoxide reductase with GAF domain